MNRKRIKILIAAAVLALVLVLAACAPADPVDPTKEKGWFEIYGIWIILGVVIIGFFLFSTFMQKKRTDQVNTLMSELRPGVKVKTIGGVVGEIVEIIMVSATEKHVVIKTGTGENASTLTFDINAIGVVVRPPAAVDAGPVIPSDEEVNRLLNGAPAPEGFGETPAPSETKEDAADAPPFKTEGFASPSEGEFGNKGADETVKPEVKTAAKKPAAKKPAVKKPAAKKTDGYRK